MGGTEENPMQTDFMVAQPSFWSGLARLFDFWGLYDLYNVSPTTREADARAMFSDWRMVGQDLICAIDDFQDQDPRQGRLFSEEEIGVAGT